jgi:hypothetical protein
VQSNPRGVIDCTVIRICIGQCHLQKPRNVGSSLLVWLTMCLSCQLSGIRDSKSCSVTRQLFGLLIASFSQHHFPCSNPRTCGTSPRWNHTARCQCQRGAVSTTSRYCILRGVREFFQTDFVTQETLGQSAAGGHDRFCIKPCMTFGSPAGQPCVTDAFSLANWSVLA